MRPWMIDRQEEMAAGTAVLERRKALLGRSRVGALAATFVLVAISALLTTLLFAVVVHLASQPNAAPRIGAVQQGPGTLQVVQATPLQRSGVEAFLSQPGRIALNGPAAAGTPVAAGGGVPLGPSGSVEAGDTLRVCTEQPAPSVELTLVDEASGTVIGQHLFLPAPLCALP